MKMLSDCFKRVVWSGRQDLNLRPLDPQVSGQTALAHQGMSSKVLLRPAAIRNQVGTNPALPSPFPYNFLRIFKVMANFLNTVFKWAYRFVAGLLIFFLIAMTALFLTAMIGNMAA